LENAAIPKRGGILGGGQSQTQITPLETVPCDVFFGRNGFEEDKKIKGPQKKIVHFEKSRQKMQKKEGCRGGGQREKEIPASGQPDRGPPGKGEGLGKVKCARGLTRGWDKVYQRGSHQTIEGFPGWTSDRNKYIVFIKEVETAKSSRAETVFKRKIPAGKKLLSGGGANGSREDFSQRTEKNLPSPRGPLGVRGGI